MNYLKNISISIGLIFFLILFFTFIMTLLNYLNIIGSNLITVIKIFILTFSLFIGGFYIGKKTNKQGWLEGLKLSLIFLILLILFEYLFLDNHFEFKNILYYLIISISCIFGSMIGISKRLEKN